VKPTGTLAVALDAVAGVLAPLADDLQTQEGALGLLADLGVAVPAAPASLLALKPTVEKVTKAVEDLERALDAGEETSPEALQRLAALTTASTAAFKQLVELAPRLQDDLAGIPGLLEQVDLGRLGERLAARLFARWLRDRQPAVYNLLLLAGALEVTFVEEAGELAPAHLAYRFRGDRVRQLVTDPAAVAADAYGWGTDAFQAALVLERLGYLLMTLGVLPATYGTEQATGGLLPAGPELRLPVFAETGEEAALEFGVALVPAAPTAGGDGTDGGLAAQPYVTGGAGTSFEPRAGLTIAVRVDAALEGGVALVVRPPLRLALVVGQGSAAAQFGGELTWTRADGGRVVVARQPDWFLLDVAGFSGGVAVALDSEGKLGLVLRAGLVDGRMVLGGGQADGFLQRLLPGAGVTATFQLGARWSPETGLRFEGSGGVEVTIPVNATVLGVLTVDALHLGVLAAGGGADVVLTADFSAAIGPFSAAVERVGIRVAVRPAPNGGSLGPVDAAVAFEPPKGAGLAIEAPGVTGGGYLFFDRDRQEYAGVLQLELAGFSVSAIGLVTTRPGEFSLLVIISVEFSPIQLGYGFTLNGVGGLLGVNRTIAVEAIEGGLKQGSLDAILFPRDPVRNAPKIIAALGRYFPAVQGQFVVGPSAVIGWGTPTVLTITLGVLVEFPSPVRVVLAGQLRLALPEDGEPVALLQMDLLGSLDFGKRRLAVDATLRDSRVAAFALTGDVAIRMSWGDRPGFLLAAGGFNPRFRPPAGLKPLDRLAISLATGDNPRLRLESYLALTSNTIQFGARLDLYASADVVLGTFSVAATLGFDALVQLSPFAFVVDIYASVVLKWDGDPFLGVELAVTLSGPTPWRAQGQATVHFLGTHTVHFELTVGEEPAPSPPELVDVAALLAAALTDPRSWEAQQPREGRTLVTLRALPPSGDLVVHPLGTLTVRQRVVPLDREITRFGAGRPKDATRFSLAARAADGSTRPPEALIEDLFAPAQFLDLSDAERLTAPSFEPMPAGARFGAEGLRLPEGGIHDADALVYDEHLVDTVDLEPVPPARPPASGRPLPDTDLALFAQGGAAARNGLAAAGPAPYVGQRLGIALRPTTFRIAVLDAMAPVGGMPDRDLTWSEAMALLKARLAEQPELAGALEVVGAHEVRP
jgi:hypothetical protein